jgi:NAD(P)-dependent dehydrogenase (short-subunit alcohol dehydrogenase family)
MTNVSGESASGCAVITGAGSGIGAALAHRAVADGLPVVIADIAAERLAETAASQEARGGEVLAVQTDVTDPASVERLAEQAYERFGAVRLLVNSAGIESVGYLWEMSPENWRRVQNVNVQGAFHAVRAFVPRMGADRQPSHVVNIASVAAIASAPRNAAYCASKHALLAMTECLHVECAEAFPQVSVSVVCPAAVATQIFEDALDEEETSAAAERELQAMRRHLAEDGISPARAAELIFDGVARGDFWITTHPERFAEIARRRADMLLGRTAPQPNVAREVQAAQA